MEQVLTLAQMVNYEMPKTYDVPMPAFSRLSSGWKLRKYIPYQLLDSVKSIPPLKNDYQDVSRERQRDFLRRSGNIKKNAKQSQSLNKMLGVIPSIHKSLNKSLHSIRNRNNFSYIDSHNKPASYNLPAKSTKKFIYSSTLDPSFK